MIKFKEAEAVKRIIQLSVHTMNKMGTDEAEFSVTYNTKIIEGLVIDIGRDSPLFSNKYDFFIIKNVNYYCIDTNNLISLVKNKCSKKEKGMLPYQIRTGGKTLLTENDLKDAGYTYTPLSKS